MTSEVQKFVECLEQAGELLEQLPGPGFLVRDQEALTQDGGQFTMSSLEKWSDFVEPGEAPPCKIRVLHHQSCSGGSLIAKFIAAMPNAAVLTEATPSTRLRTKQLRSKANVRFAPTDLTFLALQGRFPDIDALCEKVFRADIEVISSHLTELGKYLVIREHSHSDYFVGNEPVGHSSVRQALEPSFPLLRAVTVRHPADSYLSLLHNQWIHFEPPTFDEYCRRYRLFIVANEDTARYRYEDIIEQPQQEMQKLCATLELPFNEDFIETFDLNEMSGDSGRSSPVIEKRPRRDIDQEIRQEIENSEHYLFLCEELGYAADLD